MVKILNCHVDHLLLLLLLLPHGSVHLLVVIHEVLVVLGLVLVLGMVMVVVPPCCSLAVQPLATSWIMSVSLLPVGSSKLSSSS